MYRKIREAQMGDRDEGFTLIELLVVVIIIGILAAIAIPVFLNQRRKAWDSAVKSDLRNAATAQESYFTEESAYTDDLADLRLEGFNPSEDVEGNFAFGTVSGTEYCMEAAHDADTDETEWYLTSASGAPAEGTCP